MIHTVLPKHHKTLSQSDPCSEPTIMMSLPFHFLMEEGLSTWNFVSNSLSDPECGNQKKKPLSQYYIAKIMHIFLLDMTDDDA